ncbi:MAG TPA: hypothetical protein VND68_10550, partial [Chloroflexia bacterium]|nr:hypothetical protein [Chloroflexia bacterium]
MSHGNNRFPARRVLLAFALLLGVVATALVIRMQDSQSKNAAGTAAVSTAGTSGTSGADLRGMPVPGGNNNEADELAKREAFLAMRWGSPGQKLDSRWLLDAQKQVARMPSGVPAGKVAYDRSKSKAPFALDPNAMISLGPAPAQSDGCFLCYNFGLVSGRINHIAIDPVVTTTVYLGVSNGGVWKTTNCCTEGTVWTATMDDPSLTTLTIDEVTIDPNDHNTLYAATGDFRPSSASRGSQGILKSTDAGASWVVLGLAEFPPFRNNGLPIGGSSQYQAVTAVKVDPNNSNALIAGTKTELWMSYDAGTSWVGPCYTNPYTNTAGDQRQDNTEILLRDEGTTTTVYYAIGSAFNSAAAGGNGANGIYTTTMPTSGCPAPWTRITRSDNGWTGIPNDGVANDSKGSRIDVAIAPSNPNVIYAAQATQASTLLGIYRTSNSGVSWTLVATPTKFVDCVGGAGIGGQAKYDQYLEVDPTNPDYLWYGEVDVFRSSNGGANWRDMSCVYTGGDYIHPDQHYASYFPGQNNELLFANDGGIWYTNRAYSVTSSLPRLPILSLNQTMNTLEFYNGQLTGNFANSSQPGAAGGTQDNGVFVNIWEGGQESLGPEEWNLRIGGDGFYAAIEPVNNQIWYQENNAGQLWRSTSGPYGVYQNVCGFASNNCWANDGRAFAGPLDLYEYDCPATGCTHMIFGTYRVWETQNGAQNSTSWYINSPPLTKAIPAPGWPNAGPFINQLSYAVSMSTTAIAGTSDGNVWYGFNMGTVPGSATWVNVTGGNTVLPNRPILDVTTDPVNPLVGYAVIGGFTAATPGTPGHVMQVTCTANCASFAWVDKTGNLPDLPVDSVVVNPRFRQQVFVGNDSGLFYTNDIDAPSPTWIRFTNGIPNVWVADLTIDRGFTTLAAWTRNRGLFVWPLPDAPFIQPTPTNTPVITGTPPTATPTETVEPVSCTTTVMTSTGASLLPATNNTGVFADDGVAAISLPFAVPVFDRYFTQAFATTNGHLLFGGASVGSFSCVPTRGETYAIHANAGDLCTNDCSGPTDTCLTCGIYTATTGTAPNRQFVVRWLAGYYNLAGTTEFEVILTEGSSDIQ